MKHLNTPKRAGTLATLTALLSLACASVGCPDQGTEFDTEVELTQGQEQKVEDLIQSAKATLSGFKKNIVPKEIAQIHIRSLCDELGKVIQGDVRSEEITPLRIQHTGWTMLSTHTELRDGISELFDMEIE